MHLITEGLTTRDHVLYQLIQSVFDTLETTATVRIKKCEHAECYLHFVDTSKPGKRRWCSMELCGNRQKAAEFYARKKKKRRS
ncbi:CGNR zinc finger domain-containing protein [Amphibacillus cookii]|uniref:CGNR zinc finger domain-containing protein n=1 Tax=Amphibacillus cookii TaxID=767787 RepID=UPI001EF7D0DE|nr:CGNR zinc finger domain-containing protein [Amphibacillus cookii]